jgi:hypothetical protein
MNTALKCSYLILLKLWKGNADIEMKYCVQGLVVSNVFT